MVLSGLCLTPYLTELTLSIRIGTWLIQGLKNKIDRRLEPALTPLDSGRKFRSTLNEK